MGALVGIALVVGVVVVIVVVLRTRDHERTQAR